MPKKTKKYRTQFREIGTDRFFIKPTEATVQRIAEKKARKYAKGKNIEFIQTLGKVSEVKRRRQKKSYGQKVNKNLQDIFGL